MTAPLRTVRLAADCSDFSFLHEPQDIYELIAFDVAFSDIGPLRGRADICKLSLNVAELADLSPLADMPNLQFLDLYFYKGQRLPVLQVKSVHINRSEGQSVDAGAFAHWAALEFLHFEGMHLSGALRDVPRLRKLGIGRCTLEREIDFGDFLQLQDIYAYDSDLGDASVASLATCPELRQVWLTGTSVTAVGALGEKESLELVVLDGTGVEEIAHLSRLPRLREIRARETKVKSLQGWQVDGVVEALDISGTGVADLGPLFGSSAGEAPGAASGSRLRRLVANDTLVADLAPLAGAPLQFLSIERTAVADLGPIEQMPRLTTLHFAGTRVASLEPLVRHPLLLHDQEQDHRGQLAYSITFAGTPAALADARLGEIAAMRDVGLETKQKALWDYLGRG